jgi:hypothetical protein
MRRGHAALMGLAVSSLFATAVFGNCVRTAAGTFDVPVWRAGAGVGFATNGPDVSSIVR